MDDDAYWAARAEQMRNEETPIILRGDMLRVNFWGVPSNDAYLNASGLGPSRGPTKTAEHKFVWEVPMTEVDRSASRRGVDRSTPQSLEQGIGCLRAAHL